MTERTRGMPSAANGRQSSAKSTASSNSERRPSSVTLVVPNDQQPTSSSSKTSRTMANANAFSVVVPTRTAESATVAVAIQGKEGKSNPKSATRIELFLRYISLCLMICQYVAQVLLTRHAFTRPHHAPFIKTVSIVLKEAVEALASLLLFLLLSKKRAKSEALLNHSHYLSMLLPAFAYTLKNFLLLVAIDHLDAATFTVSYQLKILATAVFLVLMLKWRLSPMQWFSLFILVAGVAMVELSARWAVTTEEAPILSIGHHQQKQHLMDSLDPQDAAIANHSIAAFTPSAANTSEAPHASELRLLGRSQESFWVGFGSVLGACLLSGYSGVYLEMVVKRPGDSLWLRNFQLCFLSALIGLAIALLKDFHEMFVHGPLAGFDLLVWAIVLIQVLGGLLVAMVIRYGDNILKAFANSVAILAISLLSWFLFGSPLGWLFAFGTALAVGAMVLYSLFPAQKEEKAAGRNGPEIEEE